MAQNSSRPVGRHFLQIPGPTPLPDRILRAMDTPIIDHRGPEFAKLAKKCLDGIKTIFKTTNPVIIYTATGTGAWEAALVNTLSPGDKRADGRDRPVRHAVEEDGREARPQAGIHHDRLAQRRRSRRRSKRSCAKTRSKEIKAVCVLHNETSTGCLSPIAEIRKAIDAAGHPALLMVDTISSLASTDYRHDEWGVDVTVGGAQKGLMLPPGMSFNADQRQGAGREQDVQAAEVVLGLGRDAQHEQGRLLPLHAGDADAARPRRRHRDAARGRPRQRVRAPRPAGRSDAPRGQGLGPRDHLPRCRSIIRRPSPRCCCRKATTPTRSARWRSSTSTSPTARASAASPARCSASAISATSTTRTMIGALAVTEMALALAGIPHKKGGVQAAMDYLVSRHGSAAKQAAE